MAVEAEYVALGGTLIELAAAFVVAYHAAWAMTVIARRRESDEARLVIARGVLAALGFSMAGTLLKTIGLGSWHEIRMFAFVFVLRTLLKRVFKLEESALLTRTRGHAESSFRKNESRLNS